MSHEKPNASHNQLLLLKFQETQDAFADDFAETAESISLSFSKFSHVSGISVSKKSDSSSEDQMGSPFVKRMQMQVQHVHVEGYKEKMEKMQPIKEQLTSPSPSVLLKPPNPFKNNPKSYFEMPTGGPPITPDEERPRHQRNPSVKMSLTPAQRVEKKPGIRSDHALDNFRFFEKVGRGAHADVYRGVNVKTNQVVAIKQIALEKDHDLNVLMGEIDLLKILKHANIVKYHGFVKTLNSLNVFLEFCSGGSLRQLYKRMGHGLPEYQIISYVNQILCGLNYLHEQGVVHRDVKAANVLLTEDGDIKLADFGVATKVATLHNTVVGTPNWMAPETVLGGEGICTASDIWSLGATVIELFSMNPPYHDLNPMAALHAIGTDDHPPLPPGISPLAKSFLLECFQKQPSLRTSAKLLLKHRWMRHNSTGRPNTSKLNDFEKPSDLSLQNGTNAPSEILRDYSTSEVQPKKYTRAELLLKFTDVSDELEDSGGNDLFTLKIALNIQTPADEEENDPFLELDIENFDTNELEIQSKMEFLASKLAIRVATCHAGHDDTIKSLVKITGRMLQLVKKYPILHDTFIRDHGVLTMLELLENAPDLVEQHRLWYHVLSILNHIFDNNTAQIENFSLLGGIPMITQFSKLSYGLQARLQVVKFIKILRRTEKALLMFVSSGGLRILSRFLEEDFDMTPDFPLVSIHCIHEILSKDLTRFKSDMCRILSKYGVVFWFVVLLNQLVKYRPETDNVVPVAYIDLTIDKVLEVIKFFGQSEPRVRINISNPDLFKLLIKVYPSLSFTRQIVILKFFRSISCISELLKQLHSADILEFYVSLLQEYTSSATHYKEVVNIVCPSLYNCCYLNHAKEIEIVRLGAVPLLKDLCKINLPFRQFVLPIVCELVYCDTYVRQVLIKFDVLTTYFNLLVDPYWQSNAMDSIRHWEAQDPKLHWLDAPGAKDCLLSGFMLPRVSNLEAVLDNYLALITSNKTILDLMARDSIILNILVKLTAYNRDPVVKLTLTRILRYILSYCRKTGIFEQLTVQDSISATLTSITAGESSVLIQDLVQKLAILIK